MTRVEAIVFPDAAAALIEYLTEEFAARGETASVHRSVPKTRPARFVTVYRVGGTRRGVVLDMPREAVDAWAPTPEDAHDLLMLARALIGAVEGRTIGGVQFGRVTEAGGPIDLPDPDSEQARWTYQPELAVRGRAI